MKDFNDVYMPCWYCPYGHNCKYYSDAVWDQWIIENQDCPAGKYDFSSIYTALINKEKETNEVNII